MMHSQRIEVHETNCYLLQSEGGIVLIAPLFMGMGLLMWFEKL
jgi:hypothetical protein